MTRHELLPVTHGSSPIRSFPFAVNLKPFRARRGSRFYRSDSPQRLAPTRIFGARLPFSVAKKTRVPRLCQGEYGSFAAKHKCRSTTRARLSRDDGPAVAATCPRATPLRHIPPPIPEAPAGRGVVGRGNQETITCVEHRRDRRRSLGCDQDSRRARCWRRSHDRGLCVGGAGDHSHPHVAAHVARTRGGFPFCRGQTGPTPRPPRRWQRGDVGAWLVPPVQPASEPRRPAGGQRRVGAGGIGAAIRLRPRRLLADSCGGLNRHQRTPWWRFKHTQRPAGGLRRDWRRQRTWFWSQFPGCGRAVVGRQLQRVGPLRVAM